MIGKIFNFFKIKENWVLMFDMFSKNHNGDSIRPLAEKLKNRFPNLKLIFVSKSRKIKIDIADEVVMYKSWRFQYVSRVSKFVISTMGYPNRGEKRQGQVFIQTWHGTPLKKLYLSRDNTCRSYIRMAKQFKGTDKFCISCDFARKAFKEAFALNDNQFIESGLPRNDILSNSTDNSTLRERVKKSLGLPPDKKVLFYCPTWRRYDYRATLPFNLANLKEHLSNEYVLLIRSHVGKHIWVDSSNKKIQLFDNIFSFNGGEWPEATELYLVADVLISDYSSAIFDFAITRKPQIMYAYDIDEYIREFGLYFNYKQQMPFPMATNTKELISEVKNIGNFFGIYGDRYAKFIQKFCAYEKGDASERLIEYISKQMQK